MKKRSIILVLVTVMTCLVSSTESSALTYEWNQRMAWAMSESYEEVNITNIISSSGCMDVSEYFYDNYNWYATVTNFQFSFTDAASDTYSWHLENVSRTFAMDSAPVPGEIYLDIHLLANDDVLFMTAYGHHSIYSLVGDPGFPFIVDDLNGNIDFVGNWLQKPAKVPEPSTLFLLVAGLTGLGVARRFKYGRPKKQ